MKVKEENLGFDQSENEEKTFSRRPENFSEMPQGNALFCEWEFPPLKQRGK